MGEVWEALMTVPAAREVGSLSHSQRDTATSSVEPDPSTTTTDTGRITLWSPPAFATGATFLSGVHNQLLV